MANLVPLRLAGGQPSFVVVQNGSVRKWTGSAFVDLAARQSVTGPDQQGHASAFTLYDDDGQSLGYQDGSDPKTVWIRLRWDDAARRLTLEPDPRMRQWPGGVRAFTVEAADASAKPRRVEFRGEPVRVEL